MEVVFKVLCLGFKNYIKSSMCKFEFILAIGTTLRLMPYYPKDNNGRYASLPYFYKTELTYFQVKIINQFKH